MAKLSQTKGPSKSNTLPPKMESPRKTRTRQACNDDTPEYTPLVEKFKA